MDKHYILCDSEVDWQYANLRGEWCKNCVNIYRILYKLKITLALFANYLKGPGRRKEFVKQLIAYTSLQREGVQHVTQDKLMERVATLEAVFAACGVPFPFFEVMELKDVPPGHSTDMFLAPVRGREDSTSFVAIAPAEYDFPPLECTRLLTKSMCKQGWPFRVCYATEPMEEHLR